LAQLAERSRHGMRSLLRDHVRTPQPERTKTVLAWRMSTSMSTDFYIDACKKLSHTTARPRFSTPTGASQFTNMEFTGVLNAHNIEIRCKGLLADNIFYNQSRSHGSFRINAAGSYWRSSFG
jgi:hypothetical protein